MAWFDINASNAAATASSAPFLNNAYLIVGGTGQGAGSQPSGIEGINTNATPTATATTAVGAPASTGPYGATVPANLTGTLGSLFNNETFWLALGAVVSIWLIMRKKG